MWQVIEFIEDDMALKIALLGRVILRCKISRVRGAENLFDLGQRPDVKFALLPFRIGIERGRERALWRHHFAPEPADRFARSLKVKRRAGPGMRDAEELQKLRVVVEHLLEVRHQPALVGRVAREAAAEMIVDAALADMLERQQDAAMERRRGGPRRIFRRRRTIAGAPE